MRHQFNSHDGEALKSRTQEFDQLVVVQRHDNSRATRILELAQSRADLVPLWLWETPLVGTMIRRKLHRFNENISALRP
jgi:hypothetical protein